MRYSLFSLVIFLSFTSCSLFNPGDQNNLISDMMDCYQERKTKNNVVGQVVTITKIANQVVLTSVKENERFVACNLPDVSGLEGKEIIMDAMIKEIFPEEKWMGTPCVLTKLIIKNN